jgi:multidrug efflux pump subunit AcrB
LIYLRDVAEVEFDYEDRDYLTRYGAKQNVPTGKGGGDRCIFIGISQKEGLNVLETYEELRPVIDDFTGRPAGKHEKLEVIYNQPDTVRNRISGFVNNLLQGVHSWWHCIIFFSLGFRSSLVVAMAIPLSLTIGLGFVDLSGFGLQQISIAGLVVVLGMLVDNSIVMVENINRFMQTGAFKKEASILAASEIGWPVISATLTTILAFVPIAAMPEMSGAFIKSLPVTIMITLTVSLLVALTFTPMITSSLFQRRRKGSKGRGIARFLKWIIEKPFSSSLRPPYASPCSPCCSLLCYIWPVLP